MSPTPWVPGDVVRIAAGQRVRPSARAAARVAAACGPWFWPSTQSARAILQDRLNINVPANTVGASPILAVGPGQRAVWLLTVNKSDGEGLSGTTARAARHARDHVARWTPLAWRPLPPADGVRVRRVAVSVPLGHAAIERPLTGDSLGLSVVLALVSAWLNVPVPGDLAASAAVEADGTVGAVGGLAEKASLLRDLLPGVRRLLVASGQEREWTRALNTASIVDVELVPVGSVSEVIARYFPPAEVLAKVPPEDQRRVVYGLTSLVGRGQGVLPDWKPVVQAVATIRGTWTLAVDDQERLSLLDIVARRYAQAELAVSPAGTTLDALVAQAQARGDLERAVHFAHLVEHCRALGTDLPSALAEAIGPMLDPVGSPYTFEVRGAHARWLAVRDPVAALRAQTALLAELRAARRLDDCSHAFAEAVRLAGALEDSVAFDGLLSVERELRDLGGFSVVDQTFADAAVSGAAALLGRAPLSDLRWGRLAQGSGPRRYLQSWAHRLRIVGGIAKREDAQLNATHAALDALAQGSLTVEDALSRLRTGAALGRVLADQGTASLTRLFPY